MTEPHTHVKSDELMVFYIPADTDLPMELKVIPNNLSSLHSLVGGYIAQVHTQLLPELPCGCSVVMLVSEEGNLYNLENNMRAQTIWPYGDLVVGDVVLVGGGLVGTFAKSEPDWFSLPPYFISWEGPGAPFPTPKQPWEN